MEHPAVDPEPFVTPREAAGEPAGPQPATELLRRAPSSIPDSSYRSSASNLFGDFYSLKCEPALRLKLKKRLLGCRFGAHLTLEHPNAETERPARSWEFTARPPLGAPAAVGQLCSKLSVLPERQQLRWRTAKVTVLRIFRVKLFGGYDWGLRQRALLWSVHTKWNADQNKSAARVRMPLSSRAEVIPHLTADYRLPSMEGGLDSGNDLQAGYCHLSVPKLDLQLCLDGRPPASAPFWAGWPLLRRRRRREAAAPATLGPGEAEWELAGGRQGAAAAAPPPATPQASNGAMVRPSWELPQLPHLQLPAWRLPEHIALPWQQPSQQGSSQRRR